MYYVSMFLANTTLLPITSASAVAQSTTHQPTSATHVPTGTGRMYLVITMTATLFYRIISSALCLSAMIGLNSAFIQHIWPLCMCLSGEGLHGDK